MASTDNTPPRGCFAVFFGLWTLVGLAFLTIGFILPALNIQQARSWKETPCTVLESWLETHSGSDSTSYSVGVRYEYEVQGTRHLSERYQLSAISGGRSKHQRLVDGLPAGLETICFVNPDQNTEAVLDRSWGSEWIFGLVGLLLTLVGPGGYVLFSRTLDRKRSRGAGQEFVGSTHFESAQAMRAGDHGPIELVSAASPKALLAVTSFIALLWNGITWGFVSLKVLDEPWPPPLGLGLFSAVFVLVGAGLALVVLYKLLALFGPGCAVTLEQAHLEPGLETQISWSLTGAVRSLTRLTLELEERQVELTHQRNSTVTTVVRQLTLFEGERRVDFERGSAMLSIPDDALASFEKRSSARHWVLLVRGAIPMRPDLAQEYVLWVHDPA